MLFPSRQERNHVSQSKGNAVGEMNTAGKIMYNWPGAEFNSSLQFPGNSQLSEKLYDIVIVGAGVVGCALAYKLSMYKLKVLLLDKKFDVGEATSKGNSAIIHTGFDAPVGSLESQLVSKASREWPELAKKLKIPVEKCGALLIAVNDEQNKQLDVIYDKALKNGVDDVLLISGAEALEFEPNISKDVLRALSIPRESIADPFGTSVAYSEVAMANGTDIFLGVEIKNILNADKETKTLVTADNFQINTRIIVNVAGLGSRKLADLYDGEHFEINPRRGQFLIFDKISRPLINRILLPIPSAQTKGVLVIPTIFGNLIAGPTAEDFTNGDAEVTDTTLEKLNLLLEGASKLFPKLTDNSIIGTFSGVRCNCAQGSYLIRPNDGHNGILTVTGIRSTGFTSSPALAEYLIGELHDKCGLSLENDPDASDSRSESSWPGWWERPYDDKNRVEENSNYGEVVCYCEQISRGEIIDHLKSPLQPLTLDAIKRRTRAQMGRCQGFDCQVNVAEIISEHLNIPLNKVTKHGPLSEITALPLSD